MRTCCVCATGYATKKKEDILIYGCRKCHKGWWEKNSRLLQGALECKSPYSTVIIWKTLVQAGSNKSWRKKMG